MKSWIKPTRLVLVSLVFFSTISWGVSGAELSGINGSAFKLQTSDLVDKFTLCRLITKSSGSDLFVPTQTQSEWQSFITKVVAGLSGISAVDCSYAWQTDSWGSCSLSCGGGTQTRSVWCQRNDGVTVADGLCGGGKPATSQACNEQSCCDANTGSACTSGANSCGQTNSGTIQCNGSCSASTPANPAGYGDVCAGPANNCGSTNSGTIQCNSSCSAGAPADIADIWVCGGEFCVNSEEVCNWCNDGYDWYECGCSYECTDYEQNCGWEGNC